MYWGFYTPTFHNSNVGPTSILGPTRLSQIQLRVLCTKIGRINYIMI